MQWHESTLDPLTAPWAWFPNMLIFRLQTLQEGTDLKVMLTYTSVLYNAREKKIFFCWEESNI